MIIEGKESIVEIRKNDVRKIYRQYYHDANRVYNRRGEPYFLNKYKGSLFIVGILEEFEDGVILEKGEGSLGNSTAFYGPIWQAVDRKELRQWLFKMGEELKRLGIKHHDLNPGNIVKFGDTYKLIDFSCAQELEDTEFEHDPVLNLILTTDDNEAITRMAHWIDITENREEAIKFVKEKIMKIGSMGYRDGSSLGPGVTYHPIPFDDFKDIEAHKGACIDELKAITKVLDDRDIKGGALIDIGCAVGYFLFNLTDRFDRVIGVEGDDFVAEVAGELARLYSKSNVEIRNKKIEESDIKVDFNVVLMMNVHMWLHKQMGDKALKDLMKAIAKKTKHLFFQTAHDESGGMYTIKELKTLADIIKYLRGCGFRNVELLNTTTSHGGIRYLIYAKGS